MSTNKPKFDPNSPFEAAAAPAKPKFDPSRPYETASEAPAPEETSVPEAMLRGAADYGTFGFSDEIEGAGRTLGDVLTGSDKGLVDTYKKHRDEARTANSKAADEHPIAYHGTGVAASVATGGLAGKALGTGARGAIKAGMLQGLGSSNAEDAAGMVEDVGTGGAIGGALHGAAAKVGDALGYLGKKAGNAVFGVPEGASERYLSRPDEVNAAKSFKGLTDNFLDDVAQRRADVGSGSAEGFDILAKSDVKVGGDKFAAPVLLEANELSKRGTYTPQARQTVKKLVDMAKEIQDDAAKSGGNLPLTNGKTLVMQVDDLITQAKATNAGSQELRSLNNIRKHVDGILKGASPEYKAHMVEQAADTEAAKDIGDRFRSENGAQNLLKRVTRGKDEYAADALKNYDKRFETTFTDDLQDSFAKDAFSRDTTNGSRKAVAGAAVGSAIGHAIAGPTGATVGAAGGALAGSALDKYGAQIWKGVLDKTLQVGPYAKILEKAAQQGPAQVALTHYMLMKNYPDYAKAVQESTPNP